MEIITLTSELSQLIHQTPILELPFYNRPMGLVACLTTGVLPWLLITNKRLLVSDMQLQSLINTEQLDTTFTFTFTLDIIDQVELWSPRQVTHLPPVWDLLLPLA